MKTLFLLFFSLSLLANNYPYFTKDELLFIEKKHGNISKNRIMDYEATVKSLMPKSKSEQLLKVNFYLNQLLPQYDAVIQKQEDYWATPKEFLIAGYGDCEDYVIIKYFTLIKLGFDKNKLFITTAHEKYSGGYHMVLSYFEEKNKSPFILDNLSFKVLDLKTREDLEADLFINSNGVYKMKNNHLIKEYNYSQQFQDLLKKVQQGD
ncbi:transglutaminase-like cysteine proteinase BTLCP [Epsilonproteobacteria bacterium SCGC AD-308-E02]|jgi:predicted transglutaminase-like cysteine proteinase|nr:transglutaminase-like cysteine proteinase BTLCP [Epsilonproteobacteria bacterium SCGC AD-308-E02]